MATTTTNLELTMPSYDETADIAVINANMETIDSAFGSLGSTVSTHTSQINTLNTSVSRISEAYVTQIKGDAETAYRTGQVNLTPANIGASASNHTHSYLPLGGGTLTGDLTLSGRSVLTKAETISRGTTPSSEIWGVGYYLRDGNNANLGYMRPVKRGTATSGRNDVAFYVYSQNSSGGETNNYMLLGVYPDGTSYYGVKDKAKFKQDLEITPAGIGASPTHTHPYLNTAGGTVTGTLVLSKTQDASATANNSPALIVGGAATAAHLEFDGNEIMAKTNGTTAGTININLEGGDVVIGKSGGTQAVKLQGSVTANGTTVSVNGHKHGAGDINSGTLAITRGGTGVTTAAPHKILIGPVSGTAAAAPTWRTLHRSDMPADINSDINDIVRSLGAMDAALRAINTAMTLGFNIAFTTQSATVGGSDVDIASGSYHTFTANMAAPSKYRFCSIYEISTNHSTALVLTKYEYLSSGNVNVTFRNVATTTASDSTATIKCLYIQPVAKGSQG